MTFSWWVPYVKIVARFTKIYYVSYKGVSSFGSLGIKNQINSNPEATQVNLRNYVIFIIRQIIARGGGGGGGVSLTTGIGNVWHDIIDYCACNSHMNTTTTQLLNYNNYFIY